MKPNLFVAKQRKIGERRDRRMHAVPHGFSLIELLVATALTLIVVLAVAQAFAVLSETVSTNRAVFEMSSQLRGAAIRLERDLQGLTVPIRPWPTAGSGLGYFEYYEGPLHDDFYRVAASDSSLGDIDDILMFTAHSVDAFFTGRIDPDINNSVSEISARTAEIAWWTRLEGDRYVLRRRAFLICPDLNNDSGFLPDPNDEYFSSIYLDTSNVTGIDTIRARFQQKYDLSVRCALDTTGSSPRWRLAANSLADLTRRESRFAHVPHWEKSFISVTSTFSMPPFPFLLDTDVSKTAAITGPPVIPGKAFGSLKARYSRVFPYDGEDIIAANILSFDVKAFDPKAIVRTDATAVETLVPGDPGFNTTGAMFAGHGAFVDLSYVHHLTLTGISSVFSGTSHTHSQLRVNGLPPSDPDIPLATYDTWSFDYECDGVDQDGPLYPSLAWRQIVDQGVNGFDDNNADGVDDPGERETSPPYPVSLRGVQVRLRMIDPSTRQVRQATVVSDFTPE